MARRDRRSFSLLELMAVVALMGLVIGYVTVNVAGVGENAALRAAAMQIQAVYRLGWMSATRSGLPRRIRFDPRGVALAKPVHGADGWSWSEAPAIRWSRGVRITWVKNRSDERNATPPWYVMIVAGESAAGIELALLARDGSRITLTLGRNS